MQDLVPSTIPAGADPAANAELAKVWKTMGEKMQQLANKATTGYDENLSPEDVICNLNAVQAAKEEKDAKWGRVREIFNTTLDAVSKVGGMVASAASNVFAPAGQCYNAINFVIVAYQSYQSMFEALGDLFHRCNGFLGRLVNNYAAANMSAGMTYVSCKILSHFVDVCDVALKLRDSKLFKLKAIFKVTFTSQNDVLDLLAQMDQFTSEEQLQSLADTYLSSARAADRSKRAVDMLEEDREGRVEERREKKDTKTLLRSLAFKEILDGSTEEPIESWGTTYDNIRQKQVEGTGQWLLRHQSFTDWKNPEKNIPILGVVGEEASGKSYITATAISHLRMMGSGEGIESRSSRHLVAFYFLNEKKANSGADVLGKSIIWQFAQSDVSYMQSAALTCNKAGDINSRDFLTALLLTNSEELKQIEATFYIVINKIGAGNGQIHEGVVNFLKALSHPKPLGSKGPAVRVLFTATQKTVESLRRDGVSFPTIPMTENEEDIRLYIDFKMNKIQFLCDKEDAQVNELRREIRNGLCANTKGNYYMIDNALQAISSSVFDNDIRDAISNAGNSSLSQHIADDITKVNEICNAKEMIEINEIILWITFAQERVTVEKMSAVLRYTTGATSLRPLEERLKDRFLLFEINNDGCVDFRSQEILDAIPKRGDVAKTSQKNNELVQQEEVDILKHFLHTVCPPDLFDKLKLEDHFNLKLKPPQEQVYQEDENTGHFRLAKVCIFVLANEDSEKFRVLRGYASRNLVHHMSRVDLALITYDSKRSLGSDLVGLFRRESAIDNLFWAKKPIPEFPSWILKKHEVDHILKWFTDPAIASQMDEKSGLWVKDLMADEQNTVKKLVEPATIRMAKYAFKEVSSEDITIAAFRIVRDFVTKVKFERPSTQNAKADPEGLHQAEAWCQRKLPLIGQSDKERSLWDSQMAIILNGHSAKSEAEARCRKALALDKKNWRASLLLVKVTNDNGEAIDIVKSLIKRFEADSTLLKDHKDSFAEMVYFLGVKYWDEGAKSVKKAMEQFSACIEHGLTKYSLVLDILARYRSADNWVQIIDLIKKLRHNNRLTAMVIALATNEEFHAIIFRAVLKTDSNIFDQVYDDAIKSAENRKNRLVTFYLRRFYASALSAQRPSPEDQVIELLEDAAKDIPYTHMNPEDAFFFVGYRLGTIYLKRARAAGNPAEAQTWLQRMSKVVPERVKEDQMRLPLRLFAARYHIVSKNREAAQKLAHNTLKITMELLGDGDTTNDIFAYSKILYAAIPFEDEHNVAAALAMMKREAGPGGFAIACSCKCGRKWEEPGDMYWCKDCIRVALKPECFAQLKDKNRFSYICDGSHDHIYIPPWDQAKMAKVPDGYVPRKNEAISMKAWKSKIIRDYRLAK